MAHQRYTFSGPDRERKVVKNSFFLAGISERNIIERYRSFRYPEFFRPGCVLHVRFFTHERYHGVEVVGRGKEILYVLSDLSDIRLHYSVSEDKVRHVANRG